MSTMSLAGVTGLTATAWFYTPDGASVRFEVRKSGFATLGSGTFSSVGWHSVAFSPGTQTELDELTLHFQKDFTGSIGPRVYAASIQLNYTAPSPKVYWGAWMDGDVYTKSGESPWPDSPWDTEAKPTQGEFQKHAGKAVSIIHFGQPAPWNQSFSAAPLNASYERGALPLLDMDPDGTKLTDIIEGKKDSQLKTWAADAAKYGQPFFFRWSWEMNGKWFKPYGEEAAASPSTYVNAWRHLHDIAVEQGATNITWVWCPNVLFEGSTSLSALYPGSAYVDWSCMDGYNRGNNTIDPVGWKSFSTVFSETYNQLITIAPSKPIMIAEVGSTEIRSPALFELKPEWISQGLGNTLPNQFPKIRAVVWFNWNIEVPEKKARWDWPIESSAASQSSFNNVISSPYYAGNTFTSLPPLTKIQPLP